MAVTHEEILNHQTLVIEYRAYSAYLIKHCKNKSMLTNSTLKMLKRNLLKAEKLEAIFTAINEQQEIVRYKKHQEILKKLLTPHYKEIIIPPEGQYVSNFNNKFIDVNASRFFLIRLLRAIRALTAYAPDSTFTQSFKAMHDAIGPYLTHFGWMCFATRLSMKMSLFIKHNVHNSLMPSQEQSLDPSIRFWTHLSFNRRWFFLINDIVWLIGSLTSAFILTGSLLPLSIYLAVGLQAFDFVFSCVRYAIEINQFDVLKKKPMCHDKAYLTALDEQIQQSLYANTLLMINHASLLLSIIMFLPAVTAISPLLPVLGGSLSVITTAVNYKENLKLRTGTLNCDIRVLKDFGLFKNPASPAKQSKKSAMSRLSSEPEFSLI